MKKPAFLTVLALLTATAALTPALAGIPTESAVQPKQKQRASADMTFRAPVMVSASDEETAAEPSIRGARDGSVYIVAPTGLGNVRTSNESGGGDVVWRSDDFGKSWKFLGSLDNQTGGGDADLAPDHNNVLWGSGLTLANTTGAISIDKGENWNTNPVNSLATVVDRQWIETYKDEPFAFMATGRIADSAVILSRLERAPGDVPVTSNTVAVSGDDVYQWPGEISVDEKNALVYVAYNTVGEDSDNNDDIVVGRTNLELGDIQQFKITTTRGDSFDSFAAVDVDRAGNVYVVWTERRPSGKEGRDGRTNSYLAVSKDQGKTFGTPIKLNRRPRTSVFPWVVAGDKGRVAVAYYGTRRRGASPESVVYPERRIAKWKVFVSYSLNAASGAPTFTEKRAMPSGAYLHEGNVCTSGTGCASGTRDLLDYFQLDLDACGRIVIAYTDNSRDIVTKENRSGQAELIGFIGQRSGPRFYAEPLNLEVC
jgi:hypothetical protein